MEQRRAIELILEERRRQSAKFGEMPRDNDPLLWVVLIMEELGEALRELDLNIQGTDLGVGLFVGEMIRLGDVARSLIDQDDLDARLSTAPSPRYYLEMMQVAALALAALEDTKEVGHGDRAEKNPLDGHKRQHGQG